MKIKKNRRKRKRNIEFDIEKRGWNHWTGLHCVDIICFFIKVFEWNSVFSLPPAKWHGEHEDEEEGEEKNWFERSIIHNFFICTVTVQYPGTQYGSTPVWILRYEFSKVFFFVYDIYFNKYSTVTDKTITKLIFSGKCIYFSISISPVPYIPNDTRMLTILNTEEAKKKNRFLKYRAFLPIYSSR